MRLVPGIKWTKYIFIAALCLACRKGDAQTIAAKKLLFETITIRDGLSQGMVNWIIQDHFGFLWFATKDGLNRYDGYHFVVYRHDPSDSNSIADNYVQTMFEDSKGRLWLGTTSQGLDLFNRETETFQHFKNIQGDNGAIGFVSSITEDKLGRIWVTTAEGVIVITQQVASKATASTFTFRKITNKESHVFVTRDGSIWISQVDVGLSVIHYKNGKEEPNYIPYEKYSLYPANDKGFERYVRAFGEDTVEGKLYLFMKNCITEYDGKKNSFSITRLSTGLKSSPHLTVYIKDKTAWLIDNYSLKQFDITAHKLVYIKSADTELDLLMEKAVCLCKDKSGIIWIGTGGYGVLKHNPRAEKFHHTDKESIHWMQQTNDDRTMLLKDPYRVDIFDGQKDTYTGVIPGAIVQPGPGWPQGTIEAAVQDDDGSYWICKQTLVRFDAANNSCTWYPDKPSFPLYKSRAGEIWFGSDSSFCRYDKRTGKFIHYPYPVIIPTYAYKPIQSIYEDANNVFWLGTTAGLFCFDPATKNWKHFKNDPHDSASISFDLIFTLCPDPAEPNRYLWIGTNGGGLNRFDMENGKAIRYTVKKGLANDVVYGILSDNDGNLWMSTNNGLSRFDHEKKTFHNYNVDDGLQGNEFNRNAFCKTSGGILFFGGVNGFNYFDPAELNDSTIIPNVSITDFKISNQPVSFKVKNSPLSKPVYLTDKIILHYRENVISFDFVSFDFTNPQKNLYKYKLEGFDKNWISSGNEHSATYTNLDPGTYTFGVMASNSDGVWNEKGKTLMLVILPPWYMTWWFRAGVAVIIISAAYAFYRYRITQALKLQTVRNRIASDLHDEIGSNLSNIFIFSNVAQQRAEFPEETTSLMRKVSDYTQGSMEAMSDIVWMINSRNDRFENIIVRMRTLAAEIFEAASCRLHIHFDEKLNNLNLNMEERKNFYLIYKEAINNIAKYADCKDVWISMKLDRNKIMLEIKDNGKGFDPQSASGGNGLLNMRKRAEMLKGKLCVYSNPGEGTSIHLDFEA